MTKNKMEFHYRFFNKNTSLNDTIFETAPAHRVKQVHGTHVIAVTDPQSNWVEADGLITRQANLPIGVITADCVPVLFYADGVIGAAHAGWQGALNGVLDRVIDMMECPSSSIRAFIGPCIQQSSYEVSKGFERPFLEHHAQATQFFKPSKDNTKLYFDLSSYCVFRLKLCGVTMIDRDSRDTLTNPGFHSHRGGTTSTERNLSAIMLM